MSIDSKFLEYLTAKLLPREHLSHGRSNELSEAASKLLPRQGWRQKFSEKYIRFRLEKEVLNDLPEDDPASQIFERLTKFISDLDDFSSECTVYLPVEGLKPGLFHSKLIKLGEPINSSVVDNDLLLNRSLNKPSSNSHADRKSHLSRSTKPTRYAR